jgi:hypothetical protein
MDKSIAQRVNVVSSVSENAVKSLRGQTLNLSFCNAMQS